MEEEVGIGLPGGLVEAAGKADGEGQCETAASAPAPVSARTSSLV